MKYNVVRTINSPSIPQKRPTKIYLSSLYAVDIERGCSAIVLNIPREAPGDAHVTLKISYFPTMTAANAAI